MNDTFAKVHAAIDDLIREIRRADPEPMQHGSTTISRATNGDVRVSYRVTHHLTTDTNSH